MMFAMEFMMNKMADIRYAIEQLEEPSKSLCEILIEYYETMKDLEKDNERSGKQATKIVMTMNDIEILFRKNNDVESGVKYVLLELQSKFPIEFGKMYESNQYLLESIFNKAKEIEKK